MNKVVNDSTDRQSTQLLLGGSLSSVVKLDREIFKYYSGEHLRGYEKLKREVDFITSLPATVRGLYPTITEITDTEELYGYKMLYYKDMRSLSDEVFSSCDIQSVWDKLLEIIDFMDGTHYAHGSSTEGTEQYIQKTIHDRLEQAHHAFDALEVFDDLISGGTRVDGKPLLSLFEIRERMQTDRFTNKTLAPDKLHLFHGNFHMDNLLINDDSFMLIDPRGELQGTKLYDVCKLFVHMLVRYDEIHVGRFAINKSVDEIDVCLSDAGVGSRYNFIQKKCFEKYRDEFGDEFFVKCLLVIGGTHAVSFASYHARKPNPDNDRVTAYLAAGMLLLTLHLHGKEIDLSKSLFPYRQEKAS